ncbi:MAG: diguanylate cyclase [PVC group bacterium]|nr:diguanylate cyclase [PVC group bacterium]
MKREKSYLTRPYLPVSLTIFCYCLLSFGFIQFKEQPNTLLLWTKIFLTGASLVVPALFYLLLCVNKGRTGLLNFLFTVSCLLGAASVCFWGGFCEIKFVLFPWARTISLTNVPYFLFLLNTGLFLPLGVVMCLIHSKQVPLSSLTRKQSNLIIFSIALSVLALLMSFLSAAGVVVYQGSVVFLTIAGILIAYSIVNYRLLTFDIMLHRLTLIGLSVLPLVFLHLVFVRLFLLLVDAFSAVAISSVIIISIIMFSPYKKKARKLSNKIVFKGRYDYQNILLNLSGQLSSIMDMDQLLNYIVQIIVQTFDVDKAAVFLEDEEGQGAVIKASYGISKEIQEDLILESNDALLRRLENTQGILVKEECKQSEDIVEVEKVFEKINVFNAEVVIPLIIKDKLVGSIILGGRKQDGIYTQDDINALESFAAEASAAIENARLYSEAIIDGITKVFNYNYFLMRLGEEIARCKRYGHPISLLMVDVDRFKEFDNMYGHQVGDLILKNIGLLLKNKLRNVDVLARYSGEQFAVILPETRQEESTQGPGEIIRKHIDDTMIVAERLRKSVEDFKMGHEGKILGVTVSIGVAYFDGVSKDFSPEGFLRCSENALCLAKEEGRNKVVLYDGKQK